MKLVSHFPAIGVSNTYIVGPDEGGSALLIDPGRFDVTLLELIEQNDFYVSVVLVTHDHSNHVQGLNTLLKIYKAQVVSGNTTVLGHPATQVNHGDKGNVGPIEYEVLNVEGHSIDSRIYKVGAFVFTGDTISAGRIGSSPTSQSRELLLYSLRDRLFTLNDDLMILPGHGPPTTVRAERKWNPDLRDFNSD